MNRKTVLMGLVFLGSLVLAVPTTLTFKKIAYDKESKKVKVVYGNNWADNESTITDSGPVLLCVLNRLLKEKYGVYLSLGDEKKIAKKDLALIHQAARLLPEEKSKQLTASVRACMKNNSNENGNAVFKNLVSTIADSLKDHQTDFETSSREDKASTTELREKLAKVQTRIKAMLEDRTESDLDDDEKKVLKKWERQQSNLEKEIASAKTEKKIEKGTESPEDFLLCLKAEGSRSQTQVGNKNIEELLGNVKGVLKELLPENSGGKGTHGD